MSFIGKSLPTRRLTQLTDLHQKSGSDATPPFTWPGRYISIVILTEWDKTHCRAQVDTGQVAHVLKQLAQPPSGDSAASSGVDETLEMRRRFSAPTAGNLAAYSAVCTL